MPDYEVSGIIIVDVNASNHVEAYNKAERILDGNKYYLIEVREKDVINRFKDQDPNGKLTLMKKGGS